MRSAYQHKRAYLELIARRANDLDKARVVDELLTDFAAVEAEAERLRGAFRDLDAAVKEARARGRGAGDVLLAQASRADAAALRPLLDNLDNVLAAFAEHAAKALKAGAT